MPTASCTATITSCSRPRGPDSPVSCVIQNRGGNPLAQSQALESIGVENAIIEGREKTCYIYIVFSSREQIG
jgi:hypothetical protein